MRVFIYGTLLPGEANHDCLTGARRLRAARSVPAFELVDLEAYPAMVAGGCTAVLGEVWEVDAVVLQRLDLLEDHPTYYYRTTIELADGERVMCYLLPAAEAAGLPRIADGDWRHHRAGS